MAMTIRGGMLALVACIGFSAAPFLAAQASGSHIASTEAPEGFTVEGTEYRAVAEGLGDNAADAQDRARNAALSLLFRGLGKDRLFAEVFIGSPPVGLVFEVLSSIPEGGTVHVRVSARVDDESIRIVERGSYIAAAISLLDKAEKSAIEAELRATQGSAAESEAKLGEALVAYGIAQDTARSGIDLIDCIGDPSVFSTEGKRNAPDLRRSMVAVRDSAAAGIGRVRAAQAALEADEAGKAIGESVRRALAAADRGDALLAESKDLLADPSAFGAERLAPLRDKLALERRAISDAEADLKRAEEALAKDEGYRADELKFAKRRLDTVDASLASGHRSVDREIRNPAAKRAARARAARWIFLHEPTERLSFRVYLPFAVMPQGDDPVDGAPFEFQAAAEGAFPLGRGGIWARTRAGSATLDFSSERSGDEEFSVRQSFSLGFWSRTLFYAGYAWDWYRGFDAERMPRPGSVELGLGGVSRHDGTEPFQRADWLLALSYELPYSLDEFMAANAFNVGLEAQFRLGNVALIEASASEKLHRGPADDDLSGVFRWDIGFGLRLPPPFVVGGEYCGDLVWPIRSDGSWGKLAPGQGGAFRFYVGYSF
jgi:hypothetical protein